MQAIVKFPVAALLAMLLAVIVALVLAAPSVLAQDTEQPPTEAASGGGSGSAGVRLAELDLHGVALEPRFNPDQADYQGYMYSREMESTTVTATAADADATVTISPADADADAAGHQVDLADGEDVSVEVTVTSSDGTSESVYTVAMNYGDGFVQLDVGRDVACALRTDSTVDCWPDAPEPAGIYQYAAGGSVTHRATHACGLRADGSAHCWSRSWDAGRTLGYSWNDYPDTEVQSLDMGLYSPCYLKTDGSIRCLGGFITHPDAETEAGPYKAVAAGYQMACVLTPDNLVKCLGWNGASLDLPEPETEFKYIEVSSPTVCGIRMDDTLLCWFYPDLYFDGVGYGAIDTPEGEFKSVSSGYGYGFVCAVKSDDGSIVCFAWYSDSLISRVLDHVPEGEFQSVSVGRLKACGLRTDGSIACWGEYWTWDGHRWTGREPSMVSPWADDARLLSFKVQDAAAKDVLLSPQFDWNTADGYTAEVPQETTSVTVTPGATNRFAEVAISPPDADPDTAGHQVALDPGINSVSVAVTSWDDSAELTYTFEIFRRDRVHRFVAENSPGGTAVGLPVAHPDADATATYSLEGADAGSFRIDASTGQIYTVDGVDYDYETKPTYEVTVRVEEGDGAIAFIAVTINLLDLPEAKANAPAMGVPFITGTAQVGETLKADTSGIADEDGLTSAVFSYQWLADDLDVPGATSSRYTLADADAGKAVRVRVSFTDDRGHAETLTSAAKVVAESDDYTMNRIWEVGTWGKVDVGGSTTAAIEKAGDRDFIAVNLVKDRTYRIDVAGDGDDALADPRMHGVFRFLWAADLECSGAFGDPGVTTYVLTAGHSDLYAVSVGAESDGTGRYRVSVSESADTATGCDTKPASSANSPATGQPVISGTAQVGETLTADTSAITDADGLTNATFSYQWAAGGVDIPGATGSTYTLVDADAGKDIKVTVSFTDDADHAESVTSAATDAVVAKSQQRAANSPATGLPTISGTAQAGETLTVDTSSIVDEDGLTKAEFTYQWAADGVDIADATDSAYTLVDADEGKAISVAVSFTDDAGNAESVTSAGTDAVAPKPNTPSTGLPTITGTVQVGETLTADTSGVADDDGLDNATFSYQWLADGSDIADATGSTYTLVDGDEGKVVSVTVSFTDDAGNAESLTSAATDAVAPKPNIPATGQPAITGTAQVGETLTADTSGISDEDGLDNVSFTYQWQGDGSDVAGATGSTYVLVDGDEGKAVSVTVSFTDDAGHVESLTSAATDAVAPKPNTPATGAPTISGTAQVGETLTADVSGIGDADGLTNATFTYQWRADGADISGATGSSYTLVEADEGRTISVTVSFTDDAGNAESLTSAATTAVAGRPNSSATGQPIITGTAQVRETLTADTSGIADADGLTNATFAYQWLADGSDIAGAAASSYTLVEADEGRAISVTVSFADDAGNAESLTSAATEAVAGPPPEPLTASFSNGPSSHDGESAFTFDLHFSEEFSVSYKRLRDDAFEATGGDVTRAKRLERGSNIGWRIHVRPDGDGTVSIILPETTDCDDQGAICTGDGRMLSNRSELTVGGP